MFNAISNSIHTYPYVWLGGYYVLSNAISTLPSPRGEGFYRWFFDFSHALAGNVSRIVATRYPSAGQIPPVPKS